MIKRFLCARSRRNWSSEGMSSSLGLIRLVDGIVTQPLQLRAFVRILIKFR